MTQDFAKPSTTRKAGKKKSKPGPKPRAKVRAASRKAMPPPRRGKSIIALILLVGVFAYALYYLQTIPPTSSTPEKKMRPTPITESEKPITEPQTKTKDQRFKFYDILPESKVIPPKVDAYQYRQKNQSNDYYYMLQTGSFRNRQDAERQKATIAFQGLKANIRTIKNSNGKTWYRVISGPYNDRSQMNSALDKLVAINIEPLVKKNKKNQ